MPSDPTTPRALAWQDGRVIPASEASVPLLDDAFLRGEAVFDTVLVRGGRTHALSDHLARLRRSAGTLGFKPPVVTPMVADLLAAWGHADGALTIIAGRSGLRRGILRTRPTPTVQSLAVVETPWRTAVSGAKTLSYAANMVVQRIAQERGADDALVVDDGVVVELPTGAIVWARDGRLYAPDPARVPALPSVTLARLATLTSIELGAWPVADILTADEVFVVSATRPVVPVHAIDEHEWEAPGPLTVAAAAELQAHIDATLDA